ncbi:hypothetical protein V7S43_006644 [Phytophthora oleae]|uniref:Uncharacterized protein n=1 Tax=Phytophthora oleae TaxID=2107226 RepID=A0ABD3FQ83_9STRA
MARHKLLHKTFMGYKKGTLLFCVADLSLDAIQVQLSGAHDLTYGMLPKTSIDPHILDAVMALAWSTPAIWI